jgi:ABC-type lipoprotein release transport system permease subunit
LPVNARLLALRGLRHHRRTHAGTFLGVLLAGAVFSGALFVGDSVRESLRRAALARLGDTLFAIDGGSRYFTEGLADRLGSETGSRTAPVLRLRGVAISYGRNGEERETGGIRILGVDRRFRALARDGAPDPGPGEVDLAESLAGELGVGAGDTLSLRLGLPGRLPGDLPLAGRGFPSTRRASFTVRRVVPDESLGRFGLEASQIPPRNAFVGLRRAQELAELSGRANLLLVADREGGGLTLEEAGKALSRAWRIADAGLVLEAKGPHASRILSSQRVFIDPGLSEGALRLPGAVGSLTGLANAISRDDGERVRSVPYSFVTALSPSEDPSLGLVPPGMRDDEILVNRWAADRIGARPGDRVAMSWYVPTASGTLEERSGTFTVRRVVGMRDVAPERELVPRFPGLTDVDACRDWDIGIPLDPEKLRDRENEEYWKRFRATPRAIVTLSAGRRMWGNRFGDLTGARFPASAGTPEAVEAALLAASSPGEAGLALRPVREEALRAAREGNDLGVLFLGMSLFLLTAALILAALLFAFGVRQRAEELGTLLAVGIPRRQATAVFFREGAAISVMGAAAGVALGSIFTRTLLSGLPQEWSGAAPAAAVVFHAGTGTVLLSFSATVAASLASMAAVLRRQAKRDPLALLSGEPPVDRCPPPGTPARRPGLLPLLGFPLAGGIAFAGAFGGPGALAYAFFASGLVLLASGLGLLASALGRSGGSGSDRLSLFRLGIRNASRNTGRSVASAALLAFGSFLLTAVSAMEHDPASGAGSRGSGTGGFAFYGESTLPMRPGSTIPGHPGFGPDFPVPGASLVPLKSRDGDDASCLNLNRPETPRILGVDPGELSRRRAFLPRGAPADFWDVLRKPLPEGEIPAVAGDGDTARWNLGKNAAPDGGDTVTYRDERGKTVTVRLRGAVPQRLSILQGSLLVSLENFHRLFPSEEGFRVLLVDAPETAREEAVRLLGRKYARQGLRLEPASERLAGFLAVLRAYLRVFLVLGALGLLLGGGGMAVVLARNVLERRGELGLLRAVGFTRRNLAGLLLAEHVFLYAGGIVWGTASALLAVAPSLAVARTPFPFGVQGGILSAVLLGGFLWIAASVAFATRGDPLPALRNE